MAVKAIRADVEALLADKPGHGIDHIMRVVGLATRFARDTNANLEVVTIAALLHDVDDYKLFGQANADGLINARTIMARNGVGQETTHAVLDIIGSMGYSKLLEGVRPTSIEGMIVSDADMCDAIGAGGILRTHAYAVMRGGVFYDPTVAPRLSPLDSDQYKADSSHENARPTHSAQHFLDKLLLIGRATVPMLTRPGEIEAAARRHIMVEFLRTLFEEAGSDQWLAALSQAEKM